MRTKLTRLQRAALEPMRDGRTLQRGHSYDYAVFGPTPRDCVYVWWKTQRMLVADGLIEPVPGQSPAFVREWRITARGLELLR